jgi:glycosyltransferase involved in cell wall biosynthesis
MPTTTVTVIVCAYNEGQFLSACLHSLLSQSRPADEIIVIDNASSDQTGAVARAIAGIKVVHEPTKGLVVARETARRAAQGEILAYVDADCRVPLQWIERIEQRFARAPALVAVTGPYRFYD